MEGHRRTRNWATVVYPSSELTPQDWQDILKEQLIPAFISPIHDKDCNSTGEIKKEHFHVMIMFEGVKTIEQAKSVFALIGGVGVEPIKCIRAYARYLVHMDNPEKAQYSICDIVSCAGADYYSMIESASDKYSAIGEMIDYCTEEDIVSYAKLIMFARENRFDWFKVLCDTGTVTIMNFLKSRTWSSNRKWQNSDVENIEIKRGEKS